MALRCSSILKSRQQTRQLPQKQKSTHCSLREELLWNRNQQCQHFHPARAPGDNRRLSRLLLLVLQLHGVKAAQAVLLLATAWLRLELPPRDYRIDA